MIWFSLFNSLKEKNNLGQNLKETIVKYWYCGKKSLRIIQEENEAENNFEMHLKKSETNNSIWVLKDSTDDSSKKIQFYLRLNIYRFELLN